MRSSLLFAVLSCAICSCGGDDSPAADPAPAPDAGSTSSIDSAAAENDAKAAPDASSIVSGGFAPDPVVFVHGYTGSGSDYKSMIAAFKAAGYPEDHLQAITYSDNTGRNEAQAAELATFVDKVLATTKKARVDLVAHSSGGVSTRYFIKALGGKDKVRDYVSLAGAHHGNELSFFLSTGGAKDLYPTYDTTAGSVQLALNGDVSLANTDETPFGAEEGGNLHYNAFWSDTDELIHPEQSECLNQKKKDDCSDPVNTLVTGTEHNAFLTTPSITAEVIKRVMLHDDQKP